MLPTVFTIPIPGYPIPIKGYGLMLMLGFLSAIWMCMRRAEKVRSDPDIVLNAGFLALICGVLGARFFYVVHYWDSQFRGRGWWAAIDLTSGGLEFYGGLVAAVSAICFYLWVKKYSVRLFLDIMSPSVMWGLAFGRMGCFLNGCCFGGTCPANTPWPLAVRFPYASPAHVHHFQTNRLGIPREVMYIDPFGMCRPIAREHIALTAAEIDAPKKKHKEARQVFDAALARATPPEIVEKIRSLWPQYDWQRQEVYKAGLLGIPSEQLRETFTKSRRDLYTTCMAAANAQDMVAQLQAEEKAFYERMRQLLEQRDLLGDGRESREVQRIQELAKQFRSNPVFAAQLMGVFNALILSGILSLFFYRRRVHGAVFGLMLVLKPMTRIILEFIRADNPIDAGGLTISQSISVGMIPFGLLFLLMCYKLLPPQSPRASIWTPPRRDPPPPGENSSSGGASRKEIGKARPRSTVVETVVVNPDQAETEDQHWFAQDAICAKCGVKLSPPDGLIYQHRVSKRSSPVGTPPGVPDIPGSDPNTVLELICEACFDKRPPQDKPRAKRLARKWWKTGQV